MALFKYLVLFSLILFFFFLQPSRSDERCRTGCGELPIRFPFQMITSLPENRCGYPGFTVTCKNETQKTILFPLSGEFRIESIDYSSQVVWISDPNDCTAERLLQGFDYSDTPFQPLYTRNFTFLNCTADSPVFQTGATPISCLSEGGYYVVALATDSLEARDRLSCVEIATILYPTWGTDASSDSLADFIKLAWNEPICQWCEGAGGVCQFMNDKGLDVGCFNPWNPAGFLQNATYTVLFVVVSVSFMIGFILYVRCKITHDSSQGQGRGRVLEAEILEAPISIPRRNVVEKGLDRPTIEMYPTTLLGDSVQLPNSADNVCPICLLEYQAKEILRTMPSCLHYFHADCIDEWLKRNATCPLCRN